MSFLTGTVNLIQLDNLYLVVSLADTLMIGQSSEIVVTQEKLVASQESDSNVNNSIGSFEYAGANLPAYYLNDQLIADQDSLLLKKSQFCIGLKTSQEDDYFVLLCKKFEQIDLAEEPHTMQELPAFMCDEKMLVEGMLAHKNQVYLITSADRILDYIAGNDADHEQEKHDA